MNSPCAAICAVFEVASYCGATSTTSPPTMWMPAQPRRMSSTSRGVPPAKGELLVRLARLSLAEKLKGGLAPAEAESRRAALRDPDLQAVRATFVTLKRKGELRGCIGTMQAELDTIARQIADIQANEDGVRIPGAKLPCYARANVAQVSRDQYFHGQAD